jgi:predicted small metal-binding protein
MSVLYKDTDMNLSGNSVKSGYENTNAVMQEAPAMSFRCRDIGMDCSFEAQGSTASELMRKFIDHAESAHTMQVLSADVILNVNKAIIRTRFNEGRE